MVSRYGYENMNDFLLTFYESKAAYEIYQQAVDNWNKSSDQLEIVFDGAETIYEKLAKLKKDTTHSQQYSYKQKKIEQDEISTQNILTFFYLRSILIYRNISM